MYCCWVLLPRSANLVKVPVYLRRKNFSTVRSDYETRTLRSSMITIIIDNDYLVPISYNAIVYSSYYLFRIYLSSWYKLVIYSNPCTFNIWDFLIHLVQSQTNSAILYQVYTGIISSQFCSHDQKSHLIFHLQSWVHIYLSFASSSKGPGSVITFLGTKPSILAP